jgi:hypothetical protein
VTLVFQVTTDQLGLLGVILSDDNMRTHVRSVGKPATCSNTQRTRTRQGHRFLTNL